MEYRILGRTGLKVSALAIGTWQLSGPLRLDGKPDGFPDMGREQVIHLIQACGDLGINLIDSAEVYGTDGEGERRIGAAIAGQRDRWILSTKFGFRCGSQGERITDSRPDTIRTSLEGSLRRLNTDYVDIYLYHTFPGVEFLDQGREVLEQLKQEGKIRFYGISVDDPAIVAQMVEHNTIEVVLFTHSLLTENQAMLDLIQQQYLGGMARGALESGLLSGKYFRRKPSLSDQDFRQRWFSFVKTERYAAYEKFVPPGSSMTALALRYLLDFPTTHTIVLGGKTLANYQTALQALALPPLDSQTRKALAAVRQQILYPSLFQKAVDKINHALFHR